ncbi:serine/threonine-protein kinase [Streptomyces diastatochromogenes]|uniref:non-specific serine/threonine protein kinase n=1 Tax=Streptomyces diastatochromogenes TaxID=42236 RepID=A0A233S6W1_STRDA|nr:serine/threonine-protein kinase [Streptomyces diastatochromogenes]OXY91299.1 serine/threonine protein kinase [Streptomyces diastatochromogenes]
MNGEGSDNSGRRVVDGRFELAARLGGGGMGMVWRATDLVLHRSVAVKEVRPPDPDLAEYDPEAARTLRERVLREARALARVDHPNVVTIHHVVDGGPGSYPWIVMELVTGGSLADRLARGPMSPQEAARIGREVLAALRAAHQAGIQHRDVKPANVLLRPDGRPVLTDFGIAAIREATTLTATGSVIGTPDYMAPERVSGKDGGPASDLWSLAMMLYTAVEGEHPLRRGTTLATLAAVLSDDIPPPVHAGPLRDALMRVLVRDPAARPDAEQLDRMLADAAREPESPTSYQLHPPSAPYVPGPATAPTGFGPAPAMSGGPYGAPPAPTTSQGPQDARPASATVPVRPDRGRRWTLVGLPVAGVALAGVLVWTLLPDGDSKASGSGATGNSTTRSPSGGGSTATDVTPSAKESTGATASTKGNLLTPAGIRTAISAFKQQTGRTRFGSFVVYPEYVSADLMVKGSDTKEDSYTYRPGQGVQKGIISDTLSGEEKPVSLDDFDWDKVPALLAEAERKLKVDDVQTRYLSVTLPGNVFGDPPGMSVYLTNAYGQTGYLQADKQGKVFNVMPNEK